MAIGNSLTAHLGALWQSSISSPDRFRSVSPARVGDCIYSELLTKYRPFRIQSILSCITCPCASDRFTASRQERQKGEHEHGCEDTSPAGVFISVCHRALRSLPSLYFSISFSDRCRTQLWSPLTVRSPDHLDRPSLHLFNRALIDYLGESRKAFENTSVFSTYA